MPSRYLSFRCSVPWLILLLQALLLTRSYFGFPGVSDTYASSNSYPGKPGTLLAKEGGSLLLLCPAQGRDSAEPGGEKQNGFIAFELARSSGSFFVQD